MNVFMLPDFTRNNYYQLQLVRQLKKIGVPLSLFPSFESLPSNQIPDVLHVHWEHSMVRGNSRFELLKKMSQFLFRLWKMRIRKVLIVWTLHNELPHEARYHHSEVWFRRLLCYFVDKVIALGPEGVRILRKRFWCPKRKITCIPLGDTFDSYLPPVSQEESRKTLSLPLDARVYLYFGLLRPYKGIDLLLDAWAKMDEKNLLLIVGSPTAATPKNWREKILNSPRTYLVSDFIPSEKVHLYFSAADLAVFPYLRILNSACAVVAISYGVPVIAPRMGELPNILKGADDFLYEPDSSAKNLTQTLLRSSQTGLAPLRERTINLQSNFKWAPIIRDHFLVYSKAVNSREKKC